MRTNLWRSSRVAVALLSCAVSLGGCGKDEAHYPSPDGRREVVIETGRASADTVWTVAVRDTKPFGDDQDLGCFTNDNPESLSPTVATWPSTEEISIGTTAADIHLMMKLDADGRWATAEAPDNFLAPCPYS